MTLEKEYYQDNETVTGYHEAMSAVLAKIHPDTSARAKADEIARGVIEFESRVAAVIPDLEVLYKVKVSSVYLKRQCSRSSRTIGSPKLPELLQHHVTQ